jgi:poly(3-hydroxyalkanoate) synthetase
LEKEEGYINRFLSNKHIRRLIIFFYSESEAAEKRRKEREEHSVEAYESKFKEIEQITGEHDLDRLVERFIEGT